MKEIENYYFKQDEPAKSTLLALREIICSFDADITHEWKYKMPFFCFHGKMLCYLWVDKRSKGPYLGFVDGYKLDHPLLEQGNRSRMKILRIDPSKDLPMEDLSELLQKSLEICKAKRSKF